MTNEEYWRRDWMHQNVLFEPLWEEYKEVSRSNVTPAVWQRDGIQWPPVFDLEKERARAWKWEETLVSLREKLMDQYNINKMSHLQINDDGSSSQKFGPGSRYAFDYNCAYDSDEDLDRKSVV